MHGLETIVAMNNRVAARGERLFNCCTNWAEPDWKQFDHLELGGCATEHKDNDDEYTNGGQSAANAEFFTVYGRFHEPDGTCEAITDIVDPRHALAVAGELALLSGLRVEVCTSLMEVEPK